MNKAFSKHALRQGRKAAFKVSVLAIRCRGAGRNQTVLLLALRRRERRQPYISVNYSIFIVKVASEFL